MESNVFGLSMMYLVTIMMISIILGWLKLSLISMTSFYPFPDNRKFSIMFNLAYHNCMVHSQFPSW